MGDGRWGAWALLVVAALTGCAGGPRSEDRRVAALLSEDAVVLAGVRVDEVRATRLGRILGAIPAADAHDLLASWDGSQWGVAWNGPHGPVVQGARSTGGRGPLALLARAPAGAQIWAVSNGAPMIPDWAGYGNLTRLLNAMGDIVLSADLRDGLHATLTGACRDESNARIVSDSLRALVGLGRLQDQVKVERSGSSVRVAAAIREDAAEKLIGRLTLR